MDEFAALVADPEHQPPLDEGALLIAEIATGADVDGGLARLDDLAGAALAFPDARTVAGLAHVLFVDWSFAGNVEDYGDPRNSFLPDVMDRRLGLPITLSVLLIEVGRRIGVHLHGVGMPGHFLVGVDDADDQFVDPFHAGALLDPAGAQRRFAELHGPAAPFSPAYLAATSTRAILLRMLTNLERTYVARRAPDARWVAHLRLAFPELADTARVAAAEVLASVGASDEAAVVLEELADRAEEPARDALHQRIRAYRARSN
jgi:regulator of sirC expression with transglutaminase-like and TPR domain